MSGRQRSWPVSLVVVFCLIVGLMVGQSDSAAQVVMAKKYKRMMIDLSEWTEGTSDTSFKSLLQCASFCKAMAYGNPSCNAFAWAPDTLTCTLGQYSQGSTMSTPKEVYVAHYGR